LGMAHETYDGCVDIVVRTFWFLFAAEWDVFYWWTSHGGCGASSRHLREKRVNAWRE
jgi:hypothetical protein